MSESDAADRVRTLLLRGDNLLKHGRSEDRAREAFEEAARVAEQGGLDERVRELIARRLEQLSA